MEHLEDVHTKRVDIPSMTAEDVCTQCGEIICVGESATEIVREQEHWRMLNKRDRERFRWVRIAIFHPICIPPATKRWGEKHVDMFDRGERLHGNFEGGKRR